MTGIAPATAQQEAYQYLRERILTGDLSGNDRLNPAEIAQSLGISRMPVREALRQLDAEGLVVMRPNRGAVVTSLTSREVEEIFEIRVALEALAARFAVPHMTKHALDELNMLRQRLDASRHDPLQWIRRHDELHQFICEIGNRKRLAFELARVRQSVQPYVLMYMRVFETIEMPGLEHSTLIDALASGDAQLAETVMRDHVRRPALGIVKFLQDAELAKRAEMSEPIKAGAPVHSDVPASP